MTTATPLALKLAGNDKVATQIALSMGGAALTALCAQVSFHLELVPITLQTFGVLVSGLVLGARLGALSQVAYLAAGASGLPVFAEMKAGPLVLAGPTGGYLVGFVLAAGLVGFFAERGWDRTVLGTAAALAIGQAAILLLGMLWLAHLLSSVSAAWAAGVVPFLPGEALKSAAIILGMPAVWKLAGRRMHGS